MVNHVQFKPDVSYLVIKLFLFRKCLGQVILVGIG